MKALVLASPHGALTPTWLPRPQPDAGQVLVRIHSSSVNPLDTKIRAGAAEHAQQPLPAVLGMDLAGVVEEVGQGVSRFKVGDAVYGFTGGIGGLQGSLAQYAAVDARLLAHKPGRLTMRQAAALPLVFITAWEGLVDRANVRSGHKVLVHGGAGGVGHVAVQLARARGAGVFNVASIFMYDALAKLSLAHGQAATGTTNCAWYDAAGTTNFPKGCNNNSLADVNDTSVTYAASYSAKPKTRATANFAKTTHNGQECGVADINGSMWQAVLGLTMAGTSPTDAGVITTGDAYVLKPSTSLASLTGGFGGATDAWGTTSSLAANYDAINGFLPWTSATGWDYFGNGSSQVFSGATSGTDYLRSCSGIANTTGMSAAGTNQFGNDGNYRYGRANLFPLASGSWGDAAVAGVFCRHWGNYRSSGVGVGFRVSAYGN